jgi:hypothetical protein
MTDGPRPVMLDRSECEALGQLLRIEMAFIWYAADLAPQDDRSTLEHLRKRVDAYLAILNNKDEQP